MGLHMVPFPELESYESIYGAGFRTKYIEKDSAGVERIQRHSQARYQYNLAFALRQLQNLRAVSEFFLLRGGGGNTFPFQDPLDFTTDDDGTSAWETGAQQPLSGTINGSNREFYCTKQYSDGGGAYTYTRPIRLPVEGECDFYVDGSSEPAAIDYTTGKVIFTTAPSGGQTVTWRGEFNVEVFFGPGTDAALNRAYEGYNKGAIDSDLFLIEHLQNEIPIRDEVPYGGSKDWGAITTDIAIALAEGTTQVFSNSSGGTLDAILQDPATIPSGGITLILKNEGSNTVDVVLPDLTTTLVSLTTAARYTEVTIFERSSGTREYVSLVG